MEEYSGMRRICRQYCAYYKPGKKEETVCMGLTVARKIAEKRENIREIITAAGPAVNSSVESPRIETRDILTENVCGVCPFEREDCDFADGKEGALPCGAYIFLVRLADAAVITAADLQDGP